MVDTVVVVVGKVTMFSEHGHNATVVTIREFSTVVCKPIMTKERKSLRAGSREVNRTELC
jgi:hypothetical protein